MGFTIVKYIRALFILSLVVFCHLQIVAQEGKIDQFSLWDSSEIREYIESSNFTQEQKYDLWEKQALKARASNHPITDFYYRHEMEAIPKSFDNKTKVIKYTRYSIFATNLYILANSLLYAYKAEDIAENADDDFMRGKVYHALGWYYAANCDYKRAHRTYDKAIEFFKSAKYTSGVRNTMVKKGIAYKLEKKNQEALQIFLDVYKLKNRKPSSTDLSLLLNSTFNNGDTTKTITLANDYFEKIHKRNKNGPYSNYYYYNKSIVARIHRNDSLELNYLLKAEEVTKNKNLTKSHFGSIMNLGKFYLAQNEILKAKQKFKEASTIAYKKMMFNRFNEPISYLLKIAELQNNEDEQLEYKIIQDNYYAETQQKISVNNIIENNQKSILIRQKREIQSQNRKIWFLTTLGILGLGLLLFSFFYFRKYTRIVQDLYEKNILLDQSVNEKQTLLQETHHRVKNNLQIIASLLNLQRKYTKDKKLTSALIDGRNRVKSMALIHQLLYQKKDLKGINVRSYVENLMSSLFSSLKADAELIHFINNTSPLNLHEDTLLAIGLIINEIVTNSLKYAFNGEGGGTISITLTKQADHLFLSISDNGIGMPDNFDINNKSSFGYSLVISLSKKLDAKINILNKEGTTVNFIINKFIEV